MRYHELFERGPESTVFGMAKKAYQTLSDLARAAIDKWEAANWTSGPLVQHFKANDEVAQEIKAAFEPVRNLLPETVTLYRGIIKGEGHSEWQDAVLESWSSDKRTAELFAGLRYGPEWTSLLKPEDSEEEIDKLVAKYEKTGYLKFRGRYYVRNKEQPEYYNIYNKSKQFVTDGDDLKSDLMDDSKWNKESNDEKKAKAVVFEEEIPRERIIWITNSANCKEFIVIKR
jgi:hypothetical protein